ncbi:unnamed protein product [Auanema sp. JU1783]|nr:unnamed protein product [Auanema sp. JU1783]
MLSGAVNAIRSVFMREDSVPETTTEPNKYIDQTELWRSIFLRCDGDSLKKLLTVCSHFHAILSDNRFWLEKCIEDKVSVPPKAWRDYVFNETDHRFNYRLIFFKRPYNRNLSFPITEEDTISSLINKYSKCYYLSIRSAGNGIKLERNDELRFHDDRVSVCFATSYEACHRQLTIDLEAAGVEKWILDEVRPVIDVRELICCRDDCAATYAGHSGLIVGTNLACYPINVVKTQNHHMHWPQWTGGNVWEPVHFRFENYPVGVRAVLMHSEGRDNQFWAGHYGAKFANLEVVVSFPEKPCLRKPDEFSQ